MGFGLFKKIKDRAKKAAVWLKGLLDKAKPIVKTITQEAPKIIPNKKVINYLDTVNDAFDVTDSGVNAIDQALNHNNYNDVIDWTKQNIAPRLKKKNLRI